MNFQEAQDKFSILEQKWKAGLINQESYRVVLANLRVTDGAGRQWMMQEHTGNWLVLRGSQWVRAIPPQTGLVMVQQTGQQPVQQPAPCAHTGLIGGAVCWCLRVWSSCLNVLPIGFRRKM